MIRLEVADLVVIAGRVLGLDTALVLDLLDPDATEHALAQVPDTDAGDLARPAAVLLCALVRGQPLRRGNQQVALAAVLQFLALNGQEMGEGPAEAVAAMVAGAAAGELGAADVAHWLAPRLRPAGLLAASPNEERIPKEEPMRVRPALPLVGRIRKAAERRQSTGTLRRLTDQARLAVMEATEVARTLRHGHVGTEHLLLGLLSDEEWLAGQALKSLGLSLAEVRRQLTEITGHGQHASPPGIPFTPQARRALELSLREALDLGHHDIGPEHLLLGLLRERRGIAALVLTRLGAGPDRVRLQFAGLTAAAGLADTAEQLAQVRAAKEAALDAEDFEAAKALRDREKELGALHAALTENQRLHREIERLRARLRDHGIESRDHGAA